MQMKQFELAWGQNVTAGFRKRVVQLCKNLGWGELHASWLMSCMAFESGETFSPSVRNAAGSGAIGLIQFMPKTAQGLGTSTALLAKMAAEQQLEYVERYFRPYRTKINSLSDMYMAILLPKYVGADDGTTLFSGGVAYRQNSGLDINKDGRITKAEATHLVQGKYRKGMSRFTYEWY